MPKVDFAFLGATKYSLDMLNFLIKNSCTPKAIFYIPKRYKIKIKGQWYDKINYNYADLTNIARSLNIPYFEVNSIEGKRIKDYESVIKSLNLDLLLVLGWYYMLPKKIRDLAKYGAWGIHASLLPKYAGGAPLVWAIINGEKETGVTLFRFDDGVDDGDIIAQKSFKIHFNDDIKSVYQRATELSKDIILEVFRNFDKIQFIPQDKSKIEVYPQRNPEDGEINWNNEAVKIYNFIRAQTEPYPCAFSYLNGIKIKIINANIFEKPVSIRQAGKIIKLDGKILVTTKDKYLEIGDVYVSGRKVRFEDFVRTKKLWGGVFRSKNF